MFEEMFAVDFSKAEREAIHEALLDMKNPVEVLVFISDMCKYCDATVKLIKTIQEESPQVNNNKLITMKVYHRRHSAEIFERYNIERTPAVVLLDGQVRYVGIPAGEEIRGLIETIIRISQGTSGLSENTVNMIKQIDVPVRIETIVTPSCPYCPYAALLANMFAHESWKSGSKSIVSEVIEAYENVDIAEKYGVMTVPTVAINGEVEFIGVPYEEDLISRIIEKVRRIKEEEKRRKREDMLKKYLSEYLKRLESED